MHQRLSRAADTTKIFDEKFLVAEDKCSHSPSLPAKSGRVMQAMLKMKKIIIADLEKAAKQK